MRKKKERKKGRNKKKKKKKKTETTSRQARPARQVETERNKSRSGEAEDEIDDRLGDIVYRTKVKQNDDKNDAVSERILEEYPKSERKKKKTYVN
jgi:hypothetical protein